MRRLESSRRALGCMVAALAAGCSGAHSPLGMPTGVVPQAGAQLGHPVHARSWMSPQAKRKNLFYVSDLANNVVYVYTYPQAKLQGTLTGFNAPGGECVDKSGDVFITNGRGDSVDEYAHGAKMPKASLAAPGQTWSCSVDPTTGNLAVLFLSPSQGEGVTIYPHGQGSPTFFYASPNAALAYCGFDNSGNLFLDGGTDYERVSFWEIPKGKNKFNEVSIAGEFYSAGQVQWDGKYLAIEDLAFDTISRVQFSGSSGSVVGVTTLGKMAFDSAYQSWIQTGTMLVPYTTQKNRTPTVGLWRYPAGGNHPAREVQQPGSLPDAVVVSLAG